MTVHAAGDTSPPESALDAYRYTWPTSPLADSSDWAREGKYWTRQMPETLDSLAEDSAWPAFFPAPMCLITASDGSRSVMEREVGASIVNRFPYVVAVSVCRDRLSDRHHPRSTFIEVLESGRSAALQFLPPGQDLDAALEVISSVPESQSHHRIERTALPTRPGVTNPAPVFESSYLVYEATLVQPQKDFDGVPIFERPWVDVGSHRVYFLEINAIALRADIAEGQTQIRWRSLPNWKPDLEIEPLHESSAAAIEGYRKGYEPRYAFPSSATARFEYDEIVEDFAVKRLPPLPEDQVEVDNDRARWPCFFPSSAGLITTWEDDGRPNMMPCGSTTIVSRSPLVIAPCVSYAHINARYAPRHSLDNIRRSGRFGCAVPFLSDGMVDAIKYSGNISVTSDPSKFWNSGLSDEHSEYGPVIQQAPIHFDCEVTGEVLLGTHVMLLGEVRRILVRDDVSPERPLEWFPWAGLSPAGSPPPV